MCGSFKLIAKKFVYLIKSVCFHINFSLVFFHLISAKAHASDSQDEGRGKYEIKHLCHSFFWGSGKACLQLHAIVFPKCVQFFELFVVWVRVESSKNRKKYNAEKQKWWQFLCDVWPKKRSRIKLANNLGYAMHINFYAVDGIQNGFVAHNDSYVRWIMLILSV